MIFTLFWIAALLILVLPPVDPFLDAFMSRHMLLQMPLLVILGYLAGRAMKIQLHRYNASGLAGLIFFVGTVVFWMIPHSLDTAVSDNRIDQIMHLHLLVAGWLLSKSLPLMPLILQMALWIYAIAMIFSLGLVYTTYNALICAVYTINQQKAVGQYLLWIGAVLFLLMLVRGAFLLRGLEGQENRF